MSNSEWIKVFETVKMHEALMVQSLLKDHEIESVLLNQKDSFYVTLGEIGVFVRPEDSIDAFLILDKELQ